MSNPRILNEAALKALLEANGYEVPPHILLLTPDEHMSLTVVLANCLTNGALDVMGLQRVTNHLVDFYNGPWDYTEGKTTRRTMQSYGVDGTPFVTVR